MLKVKVGCCGLRPSMEKYFQKFNLVEVQTTFYRLPSLKTVSNWRARAPEGFEFTVKAWQAITHPSSLPTWKRIKDRGLYSEKYGLLKPTPENLEAWNRVVEVCRTLGARIAVVQTPPSFNLSPENCRNAQSFFKEASRRGVIIAWEPRGDWLDSPGKVSEICREFGLLPVVDLLRREAITVSNLCYTRLHGLNPREYDYDYAYGDDDLKRLLGTLNKLEGEGVEEAYVLFNNLSMFNDASRFHGMVERSSL